MNREIALLLGMPRAATTFMYHHFDSHPDIFVPFKRKSNYFSLAFAEKDVNWYLGLFDDALSGQVCIDTETIHFIDKRIDICQRIDQILPQQSRVILCVREPGEWLYSLYCQIKTFDKYLVPFEQFIAGEYYLTEDDKTFPFNYQNGDIKKRIAEIVEHFGTRLLLLDYKEVQQNPNQVLSKIESFLNLTPYYATHPVSPEKINSSDRRNIRLLTALMRNPLLIAIAAKLPVPLVKKVRKGFDLMGKSKGAQPNDEKAQALSYARARFAEDVAYYHQLFDQQ